MPRAPLQDVLGVEKPQKAPIRGPPSASSLDGSRTCANPWSGIVSMRTMNTIEGLEIADLLALMLSIPTKVSASASALDVPQPTVSRRLAGLRESFGDQLFVRTRHAWNLHLSVARSRTLYRL